MASDNEDEKSDPDSDSESGVDDASSVESISEELADSLSVSETAHENDDKNNQNPASIQDNIKGDHINKDQEVDDTISNDSCSNQVIPCQFVATSENPLDDFYSLDVEEEDDDEEPLIDDEAPIGPQTNEEVDDLLQRKRKEKKKKRKEKREKERHLRAAKEQQALNIENKKTEPLSHEQVGMIRYSAMARVHIGEVHNPRIGELPSRTASLPVKEPLPTEIGDLPIVGTATTLVSKIFVKDAGSSSEYETDEEEEDEEEEQKEDESFVGALKEGVGILKTIVAPEKTDSYEELKTVENVEEGEGDEEAPKVPKKKKMVKRKKKKVKPKEAELDPRRPLEAMEIEEGQRLQETTPLSLRIRNYASIFEKEVDCGLKRLCSCNIVILGVRLTEGQICLGGVGIILFVAYLISTVQTSVPNESSIQQVDVGADMDRPESGQFQPTYGTSRGSLIP